MLELIDSPGHLVAMRMSGSFTAEDVEKAVKAAEEALKANERISLYAEVDKSVEMTLEGIVKDLIEGVGHFTTFNKYYRAAIVTDKNWIAAVARFEGIIFQSIDIRVFSFEDKAKALAWASEVPTPVEKPETPSPSIHFLQTTNDAVVAYAIRGRIREKDIQTASKVIGEAFDRHDKVNILAKLSEFGGFDLYALLNDDLMKMKYRSFSKVEKYAVVGASGWMRNFLELVDPLLATDIKVFDPTDEQAAWDWVGASQALIAGE